MVDTLSNGGESPPKECSPIPAQTGLNDFSSAAQNNPYLPPIPVEALTFAPGDCVYLPPHVNYLGGSRTEEQFNLEEFNMPRRDKKYDV